MGISGVGIDFDEDMCGMARENLKSNGFASEVLHDDHARISGIQYNGIVTDLPYGKNSKTSKSPEDIAKEFLSAVSGADRFAVMLKKELAGGLSLEGLRVYEIYRHKSLTRLILVK